MHDFVFAQQSAEQSIVRVGMVMPQVCAEAWKDAGKSAKNTNAAMVPCFVTAALIAERKPAVERAPASQVESQRGSGYFPLR